MKKRNTLCTATAALAMLGLAFQITSARIDVKVDFDKNFDFKSVRTWTWASPLPGDVKMARTKEDDHGQGNRDRDNLDSSSNG